MDNGVHVRDGIAFGLQFLTVELERYAAGGIEFTGDDLELDEQAGRATGVVVAVFSWLRSHDVGHQESDFGRGEELARALARPFCKLAQEVFVGATEEVGLDIGEAEPVTGIGEGLNHGGEFGRIDVALAVALGCKIHKVDDAREREVLFDDGPHSPGQMFTHVLGPRASLPFVERPFVAFAAVDDAPSRFGWQVEAQQLVIAFGNLQCGGAVAVFLGQASDLIVEHVGQSFEKQERQEVIFELGSVLFAADGTGRVPQHLLHGFGGWGNGASGCFCPASGNARCRFGRLYGCLRLVELRLGGKYGDRFLCCLLWLGGAAFPAVYCGEGDTEPFSELLLGKIEFGPDGANC